MTENSLKIVSRDLKIVVKPSKPISDGMCVSNDVFIQIGENVPNNIKTAIAFYLAQGDITLHTARLKPVKKDNHE